MRGFEGDLEPAIATAVEHLEAAREQLFHASEILVSIPALEEQSEDVSRSYLKVWKVLNDIQRETEENELLI